MIAVQRAQAKAAFCGGIVGATDVVCEDRHNRLSFAIKYQKSFVNRHVDHLCNSNAKLEMWVTLRALPWADLCLPFRQKQ